MAGNAAGTFFLEAEDSSGNVIEHHVRHLNVRELHQLLTYGMASVGNDDGSEDSEDEDSEVRQWLTQLSSRWHFGRPRELDLWEPVTRPVEAGLELLGSGDFGMVRERLTQPWTRSTSVAEQIARRKMLSRFPRKSEISQPLIPNSRGVIVARYPAPCYSGQYSEGASLPADADSSFFYTCTRDMRVHVREWG